MFRYLIFIIFFTFSFLFSSENPGVESVKLQIDLYGKTLVYPAPSWVDYNHQNLDDAIQSVTESKRFREELDHSFIFELIPKDQDFKAWTQLFGVVAVENSKQKVSFIDFVNASLEPFFSTCGSQNIHLEVVENTEKLIKVLLFCANTPNGKNHGYRDGVGEVALLCFLDADTVLIKVYNEWRGEKFILDKTSSWPVSQKKIIEMQQRFSHIKLLN